MGIALNEARYFFVLDVLFNSRHPFYIHGAKVLLRLPQFGGIVIGYTSPLTDDWAFPTIVSLAVDMSTTCFSSMLCSLWNAH